ncbi:MAG TPA: PEGA domain-containing protein [Candidatus Xenobia bacterium]|jgi:tetratricopeptide (TPR) repeat protein
MRVLLALLLLNTAAWAQYAGQLRVESAQPGAVVYIDRRVAGAAPITVQVAPGPHLVRVSIDQDWFPFEDTIDVRPGEVVSVNANLHRSAWSFFKEGLADFQAGHVAEAGQAFHDSLDSPGKQNPANWFYLGRIEEQAGRSQAAADDYAHYLNYHDESVAAHYHLGRMEEALGETGRAATSYKLGLFRTDHRLEADTRAAPPPTAHNIKTLENDTDPDHQTQLAYLYELKGDLEDARRLYRSLLEAHATNLDLPQPENPPEAPEPIPAPAP